VGLEEIDDGIWNVYLGPLKLGRLHERRMRIEDEYGTGGSIVTTCNPCPRTLLLPISPTAHAIGQLQTQEWLTAFFTSSPILASSAAVNSFRAKAVGHMAPSSSFAVSLKPNVAYLALNFCAA
jgi:hypothetical protein